jgi:hypothetical protein
VANLLRKAVEEKERKRRSANLVERMRQIRADSNPMTDDEIRRAREELRK